MSVGPRKERLWTHAQVRFFRFQPQIPFLGKSGPKYQSCQSKVKLGTLFTCPVFRWKYPFWADLVKKIKIVNLS